MWASITKELGILLVNTIGNMARRHTYKQATTFKFIMVATFQSVPHNSNWDVEKVSDESTNTKQQDQCGKTPEVFAIPDFARYEVILQANEAVSILMTEYMKRNGRESKIWNCKMVSCHSSGWVYDLSGAFMLFANTSTLISWYSLLPITQKTTENNIDVKWNLC